MVPLVVVYFAEYSMQTGTWTSIGQAYDRPCLMAVMHDHVYQLKIVVK